jgi:predicted ATPase
MRIDWIRIPAYRNLHDFEINFDESQSTTVLLGHNSSGKSNLIEAIVEIFRELESGRSTWFVYSIKYSCYNHVIEVNADPVRTKHLSITVDDKAISLTEFIKQKEQLLPAYVFGYYSGWSPRLENSFNEKTRQYYLKLLRNPEDDMPFRRFFFCRKDYSQLVLLAFFLESNTQTKNVIKEFLQIDKFESALFVMKRPWWGKNRIIRDKKNVDMRFWNASGAFKPFLGRLWTCALAPIRNQETIERDIRHNGELTERLYLYIKNSDQLEALRQKYESTKLFFSNLESLFLCDLIDEVRVRVRKKDGSIVTFSQLSEGEQQLLTVLGLLIFTQDDESLFLLDEPDTHLNPVWTYDYLRLLQENIKAEKGQLIVASHDPIMIGSLYKNQVRVMNQQENNTTADEPEFDPIGIGLEGLLKTEIYGMQSTLSPIILGKLNRQYLLLGQKEKTDDEKMELRNLAQELNNLGVSRTHPNPYFESFANAMARRERKFTIPLTKNEIDEQARLADEIINEIISDEGIDK